MVPGKPDENLTKIGRFQIKPDKPSGEQEENS
jgi:hypothetical protein